MWFAETASEKADLAKVKIQALQTAIPMKVNRRIRLFPCNRELGVKVRLTTRSPDPWVLKCREAPLF